VPLIVGGWSAKFNKQGEFVQASFYNLVVMKAVITVGRSDADEWVTAFKLQYRYDAFSEWVWYEQPPGTVKVTSRYKLLGFLQICLNCAINKLLWKIEK